MRRVQARRESSASVGVSTFAVGDRVYLKGCPFGKPGRVLRLERGKVAVLWPDLGPTYIGRHRPDALRVTRLAGETPRKACESLQRMNGKGEKVNEQSRIDDAGVGAGFGGPEGPSLSSGR